MNWPRIGYRADVASKLPRRLFQLVEVMQGSKRHTTATLASQLGVSERTVRRDLGRLQDLDLPVDSRPGRNGGVTLPSGALLPSLRFTDDELGIALSDAAAAIVCQTCAGSG